MTGLKNEVWPPSENFGAASRDVRFGHRRRVCVGFSCVAFEDYKSYLSLLPALQSTALLRFSSGGGRAGVHTLAGHVAPYRRLLEFFRIVPVHYYIRDVRFT